MADYVKPHKHYTTEGMNESQERLREVFPPGSTVVTVLRHVSSSGMSRRISVLANGDFGPVDVTWDVARALGERIYRNSRGGRVYVQDEGVRRDGCGMDMGFDLVYSLSRRLYGDGYALHHRWI